MSSQQYEYNFTDHTQTVGQGNNFWLDSRPLAKAFCHTIPGRVADLLEVAMSVYAADRMSLRDYGGVNTGHRRIRIRLGIRDPVFWSRREIYERLEYYLCWLSEDEWSFDFVRRDVPSTAAESDWFLFPLTPEQPARVSLFSGGLDSLAGLAYHAHEDPVASYVLVSGWTNDRLADKQRLQASFLRTAWRNSPARVQNPEIRHVAVPFGIEGVNGSREEKSQRTRAFAYLAFGMATALQAQSNTLWVYENGIGAINLPLNAAQLGVDNYRGVHPRSLKMAEDLFQLVLEQSVHIQNRFLFHTKAEMCGNLANAGLAEIARETVSCDSYPVRVSAKNHCGRCTSCILRRQALHCSGLTSHDPPVDYQYDLLSSGNSPDLKTAFGLEVMLSQVQEFRLHLSADDSWLGLSASYPELARTAAQTADQCGLGIGQVTSKLVRLYQAYVDEWDSFPVTPSRVA